MNEALKSLKEDQIEFICTECGVSKDYLFALSDDELYDEVYDVMCEIELEEIPANDEPESERCIVASSIVTVLGNAFAEAEGYFDEYDKDDFSEDESIHVDGGSVSRDWGDFYVEKDF